MLALYITCDLNLTHLCRLLPDGQAGSKATSYFALPPLRPPMDELVALVDVPPKARLHVPILLSLTIRNYHPTRSANVTVHLEPESLDGFVVSGIRNARVPVLLPGAEEKLVWQMIPLECGHVQVPRIKVIDRRKAVPGNQAGEGGAAVDGSAGEPIKVIDLRRDLRRSVRSDSEHTAAGVHFEEEQEGSGTVLVLP